MLSPYHPFQLALGLSAWVAWFGLIYGGLTVGCVISTPPASQGPYTWINAVLLISTALVAALLSFWAWKCWRASSKSEASTHDRAIARIGAGLHIASVIATVGVGATVLVLPPCL